MPANTVASRKAKGRKLQQEVVAMIMKNSPHLKADDVRSTSMGAGGEDVLLSTEARKVYPLSIECKATETLSFRAAYMQASANAGEWNPIVVHRSNRTKPLVIVDAEYFFELHAICDKLAMKLKDKQNER